MVRTSDPKVARLLSVPLFANADQHVLRQLVSIVEEASVAPGRVLIEGGHYHQEIYVIGSGTASVEIEGNEVAEVGAGEVIGELGFFVHGPASATVRAKTALSVVIVPYNRFDDVLDNNPELVRAIATDLAARLRAADRKIP